MKPKIKPAEVYNALTEIGVTQDILVKAVRQGLIAREGCTENDARSFPGTADWSRCIRVLREELGDLGWENDNEDNRPTVVRGDGKVAIAVEIGDENTGNPDRAANLKYHKGEATKRAVNANQGELFPNKFPTKEELSAEGKLTWLLLRYRADETTVKVELSLPAIMTDGRVAQWAERIILDPIDYDFEFQMGADSESEPIDIPVRKKQ